MGIDIEQMGHVTLTAPLEEWFVIRLLGYDVFYLVIKRDDSSFCRYTDVVHVT